MAKGITRLIRFILDRKSADESTRQMEQAFAKAGKESGDNFYRELRAKFDKVTAELREKLAKGTIDIAEFRRRSDEAARIFNQSMLRSLDEARAKGNLTDREFIKLTKTLKKVGDEGQTAFGRMKTSLNSLWSGGLAQFIGTGAIFLGLRRANQEAIELDASQRTLASTAAITGTNFNFLADTAERANTKFGFGTVLANNFTIELAKLASKAGDLNKVSIGLESFLDIGAARGMDANATLQAVGQSILGIDEGTDKLFGKNPSVLYKEYGDQIGVAATKLTDQQKAQAILNAAIKDGEKVRGEYQRWLTTAAGQQFLLTVEVDKTYAAIGRSLQPALVALLPALTRISQGVTGFIEVLQDLGRYITGGLLYASSVFDEIGSRYARAIALMLDGAASLAEFFNQDKTAEKIRERAAALRDEADSLAAFARRQREVAKETFGEAGRAFGGRASDGSRPAGTTGNQKKSAAELAAEQEAARKAAEEAARKADAALQKEITDLRRVYDLRIITSKEIERAIELQERLNARIRAGGLSAGDRATAQDRLNVLGPIASLPNLKVGVVGGGIIGGLRDAPNVAGDQRAAAEEFASPWEDALDRISDEVYAQQGLFAELGQAWAEGGIRGLAKMAGAKVKENVARAIESLARAAAAFALGDGKEAAGFARAAAGHGAAAVAWKALGAIGGGSSPTNDIGSAGGAGNFGGEAARNAEPTTEIHIHLDQFSEHNPIAQDRLGRAVRFYFERTGE